MRTPQEIREIVVDLLKQKNTSVHKMLGECGYNKSLVNDLSKGQMPSADKIAGIAKYLGVSSDNLLGNQVIDSEDDFISQLRSALYGSNAQKLSEYDKKHIIELAQMLSRMKS